jgi:hypothetical protein
MMTDLELTTLPIGEYRLARNLRVRIRSSTDRRFLFSYSYRSQPRTEILGHIGQMTIKAAQLEAERYHQWLAEGLDPREQRQLPQAADLHAAAVVERGRALGRSRTKRPQKKKLFLSETEALAFTAPGKHHLGKGLYLKIGVGGRRHYSFLYSWHGRAKTIDLGDVSLLPYEQAQLLAKEYRGLNNRRPRTDPKSVPASELLRKIPSSAAPAAPAAGPHAALEHRLRQQLEERWRIAFATLEYRLRQLEERLHIELAGLERRLQQQFDDRRREHASRRTASLAAASHLDEEAKTILELHLPQARTAAGKPNISELGRALRASGYWTDCSEHALRQHITRLLSELNILI